MTEPEIVAARSDDKGGFLACSDKGAALFHRRKTRVSEAGKRGR